MGISPERIFNSRDDSFKRDILRTTGGRGVDVVLNSLSGDLLHASWDCVAKYGCMVEIGMVDLIGRGSLAMNNFLDNRSYAAVDMDALNRERPHIINKHLNTMMRWYQEGHISPIIPVTSFSATQTEDAFRRMQQGNHIGKFVLSMPSAEDEAHRGVRMIPYKPALRLPTNASYLCVGGLGGIGQAISIWMAEAGATESELSPSLKSTNDKMS